jgi:hypothetical protein
MNKLITKASKIIPVGSRVTCNPAPTNTDADYLVLVKNAYEFRDLVFSEGWALGGSMVLDDANSPVLPDDGFSSYTKYDVNLIVTADETFFNKFILATHVAKSLNLLDKAHRICLFQAILYGVAA